MARTRAVPTIVEQRRGARFEVARLAGRLLATEAVEIVNMSLGGAAFKLEKPLRVGEEYSLRLEVGGKTVSMKGVVAWCVLADVAHARAGDSVPVYTAGIYFHGVLNERAQGLIQFIDSHKLIPEHRLGGVRLHVEGQAHLDIPENCVVRMMSRSGMLIETVRRLVVNQVHPMEISLGSRRRIRLTGRVASCLERLDVAPKHYEVGIEFGDLSVDDRTSLDRFLQGLPAAKGKRPRRPAAPSRRRAGRRQSSPIKPLKQK